MNAKDTTLDAEALSYHSEPRPGKIGIVPTKPHTTQHDLALAYSPGVAAPSRAIAASPDDIYRYTGRGNLVAVISNGTAVLGLGNIGAAAAKPVMEGKAMLFKTFAGLDSFDIEVDTTDPDDFVRTVRNIAVTFGGINSRISRLRSASKSRPGCAASSTSPSCTTTSTARPSSPPSR